MGLYSTVLPPPVAALLSLLFYLAACEIKQEERLFNDPALIVNISGNSSENVCGILNGGQGQSYSSCHNDEWFSLR